MAGRKRGGVCPARRDPGDVLIFATFPFLDLGIASETVRRKLAAPCERVCSVTFECLLDTPFDVNTRYSDHGTVVGWL